MPEEAEAERGFDKGAPTGLASEKALGRLGPFAVAFGVEGRRKPMERRF